MKESMEDLLRGGKTLEQLLSGYETEDEKREEKKWEDEIAGKKKRLSNSGYLELNDRGIYAQPPKTPGNWKLHDGEIIREDRLEEEKRIIMESLRSKYPNRRFEFGSLVVDFEGNNEEWIQRHSHKKSRKFKHGWHEWKQVRISIWEDEQPKEKRKKPRKSIFKTFTGIFKN